MGNLHILGAKKEPVQLLMVGLDAAGKTTLLYRLKPNVATSIPTIGFNVETVEMDGATVTSWDMGGRCPLRPLWRHYYQYIDSIVMVLDSNDRERLADVSYELNSLLGEEQLSGIPLLLLANKQDLPNAMMCEEIVEGLHLNNIRDRTWFIQSCCATTNEGVQEGLAWIKSQIATKKTVQAAIKPIKDTVQDAKKVAITDQLLGAFKSLFVTETEPTK